MDIARELGINLGKVNYCLKALIGRGRVKAHNFRQNERKRVYLHLLMPKGIEAKAYITVGFLKRKLNENEILKRELVRHQPEVDKLELPSQLRNGK